MSPDAATAGHATRTVSRASHASHGSDPSKSPAALEYGYPCGHVGHLTTDEETAFVSFKALLQEQGLYSPGPPASHDDQTLLRYLRARRWVVQDAFKQFKETEEWRKSVQLDVLYDTIDIEAYEQSRRLYPQWTGRRDKRGIPVYVFEIRHLDSKTISAYEKSKPYSKAAAPPSSTPAKLLPLFALYENLTRFAQPLCTQLTDREHARTPITLSTNIVDVSGVSLRQFWNLKGHMQAASQLATAHYPETLDRIFIIGAPAFFSTVWGWVKRWFDPVTVSKIFILSNAEVLPTLNAFVNKENIPKQYGGELEWNWGELPNLDPKIKEFATWENGYTAFPTGPVYWKPIDGGKRWECVAVGTADKKERNVRVCTIPVAFAGDDEHEVEDEVVPTANGALEVPASTGADPATPGTGVEEFKTPLESPLDAETKGIGALTLRDTDEKAASEKVGESEMIPNGTSAAA